MFREGCDYPRRLLTLTLIQKILEVSNFEQTIAVHICCVGNHRGIALSGPNPTPPSIIGLGGVVLSRVS